MVFQRCFIGVSMVLSRPIGRVLNFDGGAMGLFLKAATELLAAYQRQPGAEPLDFTRTDAYRQFIEAASQAGFTGPDVEMDPEFSDRSPGWVAQAGERDLQRWVHTLIRADRWNGDFPAAVWMACRSGGIGALVERLAD